MKTEVIMRRELFGREIGQSSKNGFFNASDLKSAGDKWRKENSLGVFNMNQYLESKSTKEFIAELEDKYGGKVLSKGRGRNAVTWVHPLLFIDIALAISPKLKIEVYEWIYDNLIKFRNDSGDSYKEACAALYTRHTNHRTFPELISKVAKYIKDSVGVKDWQNATEDQLKLRDKIHLAIKLYSRVLTDTRQIVRLSVNEVLSSPDK